MKWIHFQSWPPGRTFSGDLCHDPVHIFQLIQSAPILVLPAPAVAGSQPDGESFGEVFSRMSLGIPGVQVVYVFPAAGLRLVPAGVARSVGSENLVEFAAGVKAESVA